MTAPKGWKGVPYLKRGVPSPSKEVRIEAAEAGRVFCPMRSELKKIKKRTMRRSCCTGKERVIQSDNNAIDWGLVLKLLLA